MNTLSGKAIKSLSRASLSGHYSTVILTYIVYLGLVNAAAYLIETAGSPYISGSMIILISLILYLLEGVADAGLAGFFLKLARREEVSVFNLFDAVRLHPDRMIITRILLLGIRVLLALPGAIMLTLALPTLRRSAVTGSSGYGTAALAVMVIFAILWAVVILAVHLNYMLIGYLFCENPDLSGFSLLASSRHMMRGNRLRWLRLMLSFAGMILLGLLSFGIGFLWIGPYIHESFAHFYLDVKEAQGEDNPAARKEASSIF